MAFSGNWCTSPWSIRFQAGWQLGRSFAQVSPFAVKFLCRRLCPGSAALVEDLKTPPNFLILSLKEVVQVLTNPIFMTNKAHFPKLSGCVWYRFNPGENRGEICIPTLKHNGDANVAPMEIYRCQLCGKLMRHLQINNVNHFQLSMKQIFQDLLKEVDRLYYRKTPKSPSSVISKSGIPVRTSAVNASGAAGQQAAFRTVNASGAAGQQAAVARKDTKRSWILFIGNVTDSIHRPVILNSLIPANGKEFDNANLLPFDNLHERFSTLNTDISRFECSPNIWDKKALQRKQQMDQKCPSKEAQPLASGKHFTQGKKVKSTSFLIQFQSTITK